MNHPPAGLLHGLVPVHGTWGTVLNVAAFFALLLTAFAAVLVFEDEVVGKRRWLWIAAIVLLPVVGPLAYLYKRRSANLAEP